MWQASAIWVRWFVATYQLTTSVVPDCWWRHSEIVAELYALQRAEAASFTPGRLGIRAAGVPREAATRRRASPNPHPDRRVRRAAGHKEPVSEDPAGRARSFVDWQPGTHQTRSRFLSHAVARVLDMNRYPLLVPAGFQEARRMAVVAPASE